MCVEININGEEFEAEVEYTYEAGFECVNPHESVDEVFEINSVVIEFSVGDKCRLITNLTYLCLDQDGKLFKSIYNQIKKELGEI